MCGCVPVRLIEPLLFSVYSRVYTRVPVCIYTRSISYARPCVRRLAGMRRMARPRTKGWERKELGQCDFANSFHTRDRNLTSTTACCSSCFTNRRCAPFRLPPLDIPFKRKNNLLMGVIGPIFGDKGIPRWNSRSPANSFLWEELADSCLLEYSISVKVYCFTGLITFTFGAIIYFARYSSNAWETNLSTHRSFSHIYCTYFAVHPGNNHRTLRVISTISLSFRGLKFANRLRIEMRIGKKQEQGGTKFRVSIIDSTPPSLRVPQSNWPVCRGSANVCPPIYLGTTCVNLRQPR